jgi:predicted nucleic acid-binding protein
MTGTVLSWKAHLAERDGQVGPMIGMSHAARRDRRGPGRAYDIFQEARGYALAGETRTAERLLGEAREAAAAAEQADARPWEYYYLEPGFFELETGLTYVYLGRDDPRQNGRAVESFSAGRAALPAEMRGAEWAGEYVSHQATAHLQAGDAEATIAAVAEAADIAVATSSEALLAKLRGIQEQMTAKWPDDPAVAELLDALR